MPDSLCHVSIHCGSSCGSSSAADSRDTFDLSLPRALTVGELLPWIVDIVNAGAGTPHRWRLSLLGGYHLDESATLTQNGIHDGDLLVLEGVDEHPSPDRTLITALTVHAPDERIPISVRAMGCLWTCALGLLAALWAGVDGHGWGRIAAAAVIAVAVGGVAMAAHRLDLEPALATVADAVAVGCAAILGFLVVPGGPAAANVFLAAVAAGSLGAVLLRLPGRDKELLIAVVTATGLIAVATAGAVLWALTTTASAALLSALGIGLLPLAPRLSIALAGLTPPVPDCGSEGVTVNASDVDARAHEGHRNLVGLVLGCSAAAALGTIALVVAGLRQVSAIEVAFAVCVGVVLLLRTRTYASGRCRIGSMVTGFCSLTAAFLLVVAWAPEYGGWAGVIAVGAGLAGLWPVRFESPLTARLADAAEYGALAAIVPLACWLGGAFDVVRAAGLW
ncbi:type VII secretion integral membrane protein EccD [Mycobacterium sp. NS-7484]|uniref:type VII secretion integral membrane protein EccD n=1 Tax=Mycobacterium sp. NS-7484 TaxID=1834161 RepID=UPI00096C9F4D|nr:type VII secretion integral membrane protein EccD [Mycobacterium sp. NS-7484]OMC00092.1 type VII secretion integral membrane protein EccD [Mycobacterium sp. NS-7484]